MTTGGWGYFSTVKSPENRWPLLCKKNVKFIGRGFYYKPRAPSDVVCHREGAHLNTGYFIFCYFPPAS